MGDVTDDIEFAPPPPPEYAGSCTGEPAFFALNHFATWRSDVRVGGETHRDVAVLPFLQALLQDPQAFGVSPQSARAAARRFVDDAASLLEREGGQRAWLEREFGSAF